MPVEPGLPAYVDAEHLDRVISHALTEDVGTGDITTIGTVCESQLGSARIVVREPATVAGLYVAQRVFEQVDRALGVDWACSDGDRVTRRCNLGTVSGPLHSILTAERLALNMLQRMSGIATATARMVSAIGQWPCRVRDTRKTVPGLRALDKWAVALGGGVNHRMGLYDRILIKDNHIAAAGGVIQAISLARGAYPTRSIDVEVRTTAELHQAIRATDEIDVLLLDNMVTSDGDTTRLAAAVRTIGGRLKTEATGNVDLSTVAAIAATGVDYVSCGALTHSARALDIAMKVV